LRAKKILWTEKKYPITKKIPEITKKIEISDKTISERQSLYTTTTIHSIYPKEDVKQMVQIKNTTNQNPRATPDISAKEIRCPECNTVNSFPRGIVVGNCSKCGEIYFRRL